MPTAAAAPAAATPAAAAAAPAAVPEVVAAAPAVAVALPTAPAATAATAGASGAPEPQAQSRPADVHIALDGSMEAALRLAVPAGAPRFVLLTFGNLGVKEHLLNFVAHARRARIPHVVGAVDVATFDLLASQGAPVYRTPLAAEGFHLDGSNQHSSGSWKKFAGMRTGEVAKFVAGGTSVMHTDCDVVWLRDPTPYLMCEAGAAASGEFANGTRFPCAPLREADVAVSSDNMSPDRAAQLHASYAAGGTFNTGLLFIRPTPAGRRFASEWHRLVVSPPRGSRFSPLTSDQQVETAMSL